MVEEDVVVDGGEEIAPYEFGDEVKTQLVSCLCHDTGFLTATDGLIKPSYFDNQIESVFARIAIEHFRKFGSAPSKAVWRELIRNAFRDKWFRESDKVEAVEKLKELFSVEVTDRAWLLSVVEEFARQAAMTAALIKSVGILQKPGDAERFDKIRKEMSGSFEVGLNVGDEDSDYFAEIEDRTRTRIDALTNGKPKTGVTTGIKELDEALPMHQGFGISELSIFLGGAKSGKSFALQYACARAVEAGYNCLFISLENSVSVVNQRFDSYFSGIGITEQFSQPHAIETGVKAAATNAGMGLLRVRNAPAGTFKAADLERILEAYVTKGIIFSAIYADYLDIASPNHRSNDPIENSKNIYIEFRQIAVKWKLAMISASQINRTGMNSAVVQATHVSDDVNKIRTADLAIGVSRGESDRAEHKVRLTLAASRNSDDGITIFATTDFNRGRFVDAVEAVE